MVVKKFILGDLQTNCYLVFDQKTKECLIIDPADDANFISEKIIYWQLTPKAIYATHGHFDHILAADELQKAFKIPFYIGKGEEKIVKKMNYSARFWLKRKIIEQPPEISGFLKEKISFGNELLEIFLVPDHTPGGAVFVHREEKILFLGDTASEPFLKTHPYFSGFLSYPGHESEFYL